MMDGGVGEMEVQGFWSDLWTREGKEMLAIHLKMDCNSTDIMMSGLLSSRTVG
jgi:hypothetical protein